jgi:hypothetical protein
LRHAGYKYFAPGSVPANIFGRIFAGGSIALNMVVRPPPPQPTNLVAPQQSAATVARANDDGLWELRR